MEHTFSACQSSISEITELFSKKIKSYKIDNKLCKEYELLIEEILIKTISCATPNSKITFEIKRHLGSISAKIKCPGSPVSLETESGTDYSGQILSEYSEYLRQSYSFGVNEITFTTSFSSNRLLLQNLISIGVAIILGLLFRLCFSSSTLSFINENITLPIVLMFFNFMQIFSVPLAFFALATSIINIRRSFDRNNKTIRLIIHYFISAIIAIAIGILSWFIFSGIISKFSMSSYITKGENFIGHTFKDFLQQISTTNIIEPFISSNPIPFLIIALLTGLASSSIFGKSGNTLCNNISAINDLFARLTLIIYSFIPFFLFFAIFNLTINIDLAMLGLVGICLSAVLVSMILLVIYYIIKLIIAKVNIVGFFKSYSKLILDNLKIASNIDSLPYNKRILARKTKLSRDYLNEGLKLGTYINMDGNRLTVIVVLLTMITAVGIEISPMKYVGIALILLLFSAGAPNMPGSFLLGMIILMSFVGISSNLLVVVLILEALISKLYSFLNTIGDIVTLVIEDNRQQRKKNKSNCQ